MSLNVEGGRVSLRLHARPSGRKRPIAACPVLSGNRLRCDCPTVQGGVSLTSRVAMDRTQSHNSP